MRKIYTLFVVCMFAFAAIAQDATFKKLPDGAIINIDGITDGIWAAVDVFNVDKPLALDAVPFTLDLATWQACWNDTAIIVLITVAEDTWCPAWCEPALADWMSDKPEVYFDVNDTLLDGVGPSAQPNGHYQYAPGFTELQPESDTLFADSWQGWWFGYAYVVEDPDYVFEYSFALADITDHLGLVLDPMAIDTIGFDVCVIDRDAGESIRKRAVWMQDASVPPIDEAWNNMDGAGTVVFSDEPITGIYTPEVSNFSVYPNPAMDYIQIEASFNEVVITNIIGQEALILRDVKGTRLDVSSLGSGLYFISLYNNNKYIGTTKFTIK